MRIVLSIVFVRCVVFCANWFLLFYMQLCCIHYFSGFQKLVPFLMIGSSTLVKNVASKLNNPSSMRTDFKFMVFFLNIINIVPRGLIAWFQNPFLEVCQGWYIFANLKVCFYYVYHGWYILESMDTSANLFICFSFFLVDFCYFFWAFLSCWI